MHGGPQPIDPAVAESARRHSGLFGCVLVRGDIELLHKINRSNETAEGKSERRQRRLAAQDKHPLNVLRSRCRPIRGEKRRPRSACLRPISGQLLMAGARSFHFPPVFAGAIGLSRFQGQG